MSFPELLKHFQCIHGDNFPVVFQLQRRCSIAAPRLGNKQQFPNRFVGARHAGYQDVMSEPPPPPPPVALTRPHSAFPGHAIPKGEFVAIETFLPVP
ncbi:MAG: hypothetical protein NTV46_04315 [Verrucomicrobia bacterium]|nr:hypothetical protein [Verrucomicrobiota bacterium]